MLSKSVTSGAYSALIFSLVSTALRFFTEEHVEHIEPETKGKTLNISISMD